MLKLCNDSCKVLSIFIKYTPFGKAPTQHYRKSAHNGFFVPALAIHIGSFNIMKANNSFSIDKTSFYRDWNVYWIQKTYIKFDRYKNIFYVKTHIPSSSERFFPIKELYHMQHRFHVLETFKIKQYYIPCCDSTYHMAVMVKSSFVMKPKIEFVTA